MRVRIEYDRCEGNALCNLVAPEVFQLTDDTAQAVVVVDTVPPQLEGEVWAAIGACPEAAIELY
jgi:ferredoxin